MLNESHMASVPFRFMVSAKSSLPKRPKKPKVRNYDEGLSLFSFGLACFSLGFAERHCAATPSLA